jgi:predicted dehydrogenase
MFKVGFVGFGFMGAHHAQCWKATEEVELAGVADVREERRKVAADRFGCPAYGSIEELLDAQEMDALDVCSPTFLHAEHAVAGCKRGLHVLTEKPMAIDVESCDRMIAAADEAGVTLMVAQVLRFWPEYMAIKEIVDSGKYGKVLFAHASRYGGPPAGAWENWFADPKRSGGGVLDLHIHDADYLQYLLGMPTKLIAGGSKTATGATDSIVVESWGYPSGATVTAHGSLMMSKSYGFTMRLLVNLEHASVTYGYGTPSLMVYPNDGEPFEPEMPQPPVKESAAKEGNVSSLGGYYNEIKYFLECVKTGRKTTIVTPRDAREAVRLCKAAEKSAETHEVITL